MLFYPQEKLALFIDGANLYGAAKGLAFDIDYKRLLELFARKGVLVRAFYYTAVAEDQEFSPLRPLVDWLLGKFPVRNGDLPPNLIAGTICLTFAMSICTLCTMPSSHLDSEL